MHLSITTLHIYPLKGARGLRVPVARAGQRGFDGDRRWMCVDAGGTFLSQRRHPRLALVEAAPQDGGSLGLRTPGLPELHVALPEDRSSDRSSVQPVTIWSDTVETLDAGPEAAAWLTRHLGEPARLVRLPDWSVRLIDPAYAVGEVSLADGYPYLLVSEASLAELNRRLAAPLTMDRFRPNIVVTGSPPHAEDEWRVIRVGAVRFRVVKPCSRCKVTTVDQRTGEVGPEPLHTLATYRLRDGKVMFGQNLVALDEGLVRVGDPVTVIE